MAEILKTTDPLRKERLLLEISRIDEVVDMDETMIDRAREIHKLGFDLFDSMHFSVAEKGKVDIFLSTDKNL